MSGFSKPVLKLWLKTKPSLPGIIWFALCTPYSDAAGRGAAGPGRDQEVLSDIGLEFSGVNR